MRKFTVPVVVLFCVSLVTIPIAAYPAEGTLDSPANDESTTDVDSYLNQSLDTPVEGEQNIDEDQFQGALNNQSSGSGLAWFLVKVGLALGVVIGGIWVVSKVLQKSGMTGTDNEIMGVRSTLPLGQNQYLQIVEVGSQYFMLGVTDNSVNLLDELTDNETIRRIKKSNERNSESESNGFGEVVKNAIGVEDHQFNQNETRDYLDELHQKINRMSEEGESTR